MGKNENVEYVRNKYNSKHNKTLKTKTVVHDIQHDKRKMYLMCQKKRSNSVPTAMKKRTQSASHLVSNTKEI